MVSQWCHGSLVEEHALSPQPELARRLSIADAVVIGLGAMIGAGVFAAPGPAAAGRLQKGKGHQAIIAADRVSEPYGPARLVGFAIRPFALYQLAVPAQQGLRCHAEAGPTLPRQQATRRCQKNSVSISQIRAKDLATQNT